MCRGLTSPGAKLADLPKGTVVVSLLATNIVVTKKTVSWNMNVILNRAGDV